MRRNRTGKSWLALLLPLVVFWGAAVLQSVSGQTDQSSGIPDGYTIIEGDIIMPISFVNSLKQRLPNSPAATFNTNFWSNGIIPFEFDNPGCPVGAPTTCVSAANQTAMLNAMAVLEGVANLNFQQCASNNCSGDYVHIQSSATVNNSFVGRIGGEQVINIVSWGTRFIIVHELLHCLGFFHEQSRPDRGTFVQILCNNIQGGCSGSTFLNNFTVESAATAYGNYDFDSVMHYGQCSFSTNNTCPNVSIPFPDGGITISVLAPNTALWQNAIGQRNHLSALDQASVSFIYPQANWRFLDTSYNGANGASNGTFLRPFTTLTQAITNTPLGGTLWILRTQHFSAIGTHTKQITIRAAPNVAGTFGS